MTPPISGGFLIILSFTVKNKVHYLVFRVQTVPRKERMLLIYQAFFRFAIKKTFK